MIDKFKLKNYIKLKIKKRVSSYVWCACDETSYILRLILFAYLLLYSNSYLQVNAFVCSFCDNTASLNHNIC